MSIDAIRPVPTSRPDLYAFEVTGKIAEADVERMAAIVTAGFDRFDKVDILLTMPGYDGAELGAVFDKEGLSATLRSSAHVRRYAVVGAPGWAKAMINLFSPVSPVEAKTFELEDEAAAWAWIGGSRADAS